jgi:hypothetical protein
MTTAQLLAVEDPETLIDQITEGKWGDWTTYKCPVCGFDSTNAEITRKHVRGHINWINVSRPAPPRTPGTGLFDADGKLI